MIHYLDGKKNISILFSTWYYQHLYLALHLLHPENFPGVLLADSKSKANMPLAVEIL